MKLTYRQAEKLQAAAIYLDYQNLTPQEQRRLDRLKNVKMPKGYCEDGLVKKIVGKEERNRNPNKINILKL